MEFDLTAVVAIWMGGVIVLVPLVGLLARYGIVPLLDAVTRMRSAGPAGVDGGREAAVDERLSAVEKRVRALTHAVARLEEAGADRQAPLV